MVPRHVPSKHLSSLSQQTLTWTSTTCYSKATRVPYYTSPINLGYYRPRFFESIQITRDLLSAYLGQKSSQLSLWNRQTDGRSSSEWDTQRGYPALINRVDVSSRPWFIISQSFVGFSQLILFATFTIYTGIKTFG